MMFAVTIGVTQTGDRWQSSQKNPFGALELFPLVKPHENLQRMILVSGIILKVLVEMLKSFLRNSFLS